MADNNGFTPMAGPYLEMNNAWLGVIKLAERLGVEPLSDDKQAAIMLSIDGVGSYDMIALVNALLDHVDSVLAASSR